MFSLKKPSVLVVAAGLTLTLAACGSNDESVGSGSPTTGAPSSAKASAAPSAAASPVAAIDKLTGKQTAVTLDPAFLAALKMLKLTPDRVGDATLDAKTGKIAFPITGGEVTYFKPDSGVTPFVQGEIIHLESGLSLTGGGKVVELTDLVVDPDESMVTAKVTVDGKTAVPSAPVFSLDGSTVKPLEANASAGTAVLGGAGVSLTSEAAELLNMTFGTEALKGSIKVGIAEITLALPKS